ncbi:alpha/beta fold hydrolase [Pontiella sp.]|uniref:alpha/beta fold hydrolase n=1 Tax=Pontiella sp. TaxID=2837462 RepID=UPI0035672FFA
MKPFSLIGGLAVALVCGPLSAGAQTEASYDAELQGYPYPFPVERFEFESQQQPLQMAYMHLRGDGRKPTVVLLHGKNFSGAYWAQTAQFLQSRGYGVLIPDQIGFGKSSKPAHYQFSFAQLADNTRALIRKLKIEKPIVVGHSMGGMLATRYALMYGNEVERLILVNPIGLEDYLEYVEYKPIDFFYAAQLKQTAESVKAYQLKFYYDGKWDEAYDELVEFQIGWINSPDWPQVAWNNALTYDMIFTQPVCNEWSRLQVPTRLIIGTRDRTGPGRDWKKAGVTYLLGQYQNLGKQTAAAIPDAKLYELEGLGHMPQIEAFDRFVAEFEKALQ